MGAHQMSNGTCSLQRSYRDIHKHLEMNMSDQFTSALLTEAEAAKFLGLKAAIIRQWRLLKRGPRYFKVRGAVRYKSEDLEQFVKSGALLMEGFT
jgi:hypothetical protein